MAVIKLDEGVYARVYSVNQQWAYKVAFEPLPGLLREFIFMKQCDHPCILKGVEASFNGYPLFPELQNIDFNSYCVIKMPRAQTTLFNKIKDCDLTAEQIKTIMLDCLLGLQYLHSNDIYHLDIKPENILLFTNQNNMHAKLCDFNLSVQARWKISSELVGTTWYRAPEVLSHGFVGSQTDIWAWACMLYELVTGSAIMFGCKTESSINLLSFMQSKHCFDSNVHARYDFWLQKLKQNVRTNLSIDLTHIAQLMAWALDPNHHTRPTAELLFQHQFWNGNTKYRLKIQNQGKSYRSQLHINQVASKLICNHMTGLLRANPLDDKFIIKTTSLCHDLAVRLPLTDPALAVVTSYGLAYCIYNNQNRDHIWISLIHFAIKQKWLPECSCSDVYKTNSDILSLLKHALCNEWLEFGVYTLHFAELIDPLCDKYTVNDWIIWWEWFEQLKSNSILKPDQLMEALVSFSIPNSQKSIASLAT